VPLNTDAPSYELVPFSDVDDDLVEATASWAADLTDTEYRDHAETLVKRLWPDEYENHDGWEAALKSWAEAESEREERQNRPVCAPVSAGVSEKSRWGAASKGLRSLRSGKMSTTPSTGSTRQTSSENTRPMRGTPGATRTTR